MSIKFVGSLKIIDIFFDNSNGNLEILLLENVSIIYKIHKYTSSKLIIK
jgi:hypothetical protein